jgi:hypothetical protein
MPQNYFCKKRCKKLDHEFEICNDCYKRGLSGYENQSMCREFNVTTLEEDLKECQ